jgi:hypothetical protein
VLGSNQRRLSRRFYRPSALRVTWHQAGQNCGEHVRSAWRPGILPASRRKGRARLDVPRMFSEPYLRFSPAEIFELLFRFTTWGGWGSNPRPADYEKYGPVHRTHYLHGYHGAVPLVTLIAPFAPMVRSTDRSTPDHGDHRMPATERYRRQPGVDMQGYGRRATWSIWTTRRSSSIV